MGGRRRANGTVSRSIQTGPWWGVLVRGEAYCRWLGRRLGLTVRLPTLAEKVFAVSPDGRIYPWGNEAPSKELVNFGNNIGTPTPVGIYPNGAGLYGHQDLAGNVWEWCEDGEAELDPNLRRDLRWLTGGSWYEWDIDALATVGRSVDLSSRSNLVGFRVATEPTSS